MKQRTDDQVIKSAIASTLMAEEKALGAFLAAMHDCKLDGKKMREAMIRVLGLTGEAQPAADDKVCSQVEFFLSETKYKVTML